MRVLIIKTSSMGDVIHTLPALTDAGNIFPNISFDWVVEENFKEIPSWHPLVKQVFPVAIRRWRKNIFSLQTFKEWREFQKILAQEKYDYVIDAQGLLKSAFITYFAKGLRCGLDKQSARESLAAYFYQKKYFIPREQHAITRIRQLMAQILNYQVPETTPHYGIDRNRFRETHSQQKYLVFLHGTTWPTKHWPENNWFELAKLAEQAGFVVKLPWGNAIEKERAEKIASHIQQAEILPRMGLSGLAKVLAGAQAVVGVDTGLCHLTAALNVPAVSIYGPTNPTLTGALGQSQIHLSATLNCAPCLNRECSNPDYSPLKFLGPPCFATLGPRVVWTALEALL